jgi:catechol 2,3-dioxygenase-like lactoylglutathione lyase family enzyme
MPAYENKCIYRHAHPSAAELAPKQTTGGIFMFANSSVVTMVVSTNLDAARAFYGGTLGLPEAELPQDTPANAVLYAGGGGTNLFIYERPNPPKADHTLAGFVVDDVDAAADYLIERGVTLKTYPDMEGVKWDSRGVALMNNQKSAWFSDPEGNIFSIVSMP